jgi:Tol biopolymer transport system component
MKRLLPPALAAGLACLTLGLPAFAADNPSLPAPATLPARGPASDVIFTGYHAVYRVSPKGGRPLRITAARDSLWTSASPTLAFESGAGVMYRVRIAGGRLKRLGPGYGPVWSPDGKRLAYFRGDSIWVMKADGTGGHPVVADNYQERDPTVAWSPDSSKLAYARCSSSSQSDDPCGAGHGIHIDMIRLDGTHRRQVSSRLGSCPAWSSKGALAFDGNGTEIVQKSGKVKSYPQAAGCPVWAPSGKRLALTTGDGIFVLNADGSGHRRITIVPHSPTVFAGPPAWSADGKWLTVIDGGCALRRQRPAQVWIVRANGTGLQRLFPDGFRRVKPRACP